MLARLGEVGKKLIDAGYGNLVYFSAGRWLGHGNLLERWNFLSYFLRSRALGHSGALRDPIYWFLETHNIVLPY